MKVSKRRFEPWTYAYRLFGERAQKLLPHFGELRTQMRGGGIHIPAPAYISYMMLLSVIAFAAPALSLPFLLPIVFRIPLLSIGNFMLSLLIAAACSTITFTIMYSYPKIKYNHRNNPIERSLPYVSSFLTLLSSSNVPPKRILNSMATIPTLSEVRQDFNDIIRDVEIFGQDLLTSISENLKFIPNKRMQEMLSGYILTIRTGGNPTDYLQITTDNIMKERLLRLNSSLESLSALAEIYIMILVAMPLLFVTLFATLGMLGGVSTINPAFMLNLLVYILIPLMAAVLMVLVDSSE